MKVLAILGRSIWAVLVLALTGAVVLAGVRFPTPATPAVPPEAVAVPAPGTVLVCPGPIRLPTELEPGADVSYDPQFDTSQTASVSQLAVITARPGAGGAAEGVIRALAGGPDLARVIEGAGGTRLSDPAAALVIRADAVDEVPAWVAGTLNVRTDDGDLRGLVAAACQLPAAQTWLVGGGTELGTSARLVLQNPGVTPATVTVRMWGASGPVEVAGTPEYLVPPGSERVVLLEGIAAEQRHVVVQTSAVGGLVTAYLQDSRMRGLVPAGVDDVVGGQPPALQQVVPGVVVVESAAGDAEAGVLRVLAPGADGGAVEVTLLGAAGPVSLPGANADLEPGAVLDIPLSGLPAGSYTAVVTAGVPVVAGALLMRGATGEAAEQPSELAWAPSVALGRAGPLALPDGATGQLLLAVVPHEGSAGPSTVTIEAQGSDGTTVVERRVPEGSTVALPLAGLADGISGLVVRTEDGRIAWAVVLESDDMVSVLAPVPPRTPQPQVAVQVR